MNYLKQILSFQHRLPFTNLNPNDISVYYALLYTNNQYVWEEQFDISHTTLASISKVDYSKISNSIKKLSKEGLVNIQYGMGKTPNLYSIVDIGDNQSKSNSKARLKPVEGSQTVGQEIPLPIYTKGKEKYKTKYAEFVSLTEEEYQKLVSSHGEDGTKRIIEILDNYKGSSGKKYKDDYRAILTWVVKRYLEEPSKPTHKDDTFGVGW